jgi:capsular polysaccharide transport system ATP-binding protein
MVCAEPLVQFQGVVRSLPAAKASHRLVLNGIDWTLHRHARVAVLSDSQQAADSFVECAAGVVTLQQGTISTNSNISWPVGEPSALVGSLTARQNAAFLQRIYGTKRNRAEEMKLISQLSDFDVDFFDRPLSLCSKAMKARFRLAVSLVFDFDLFVVPKLSAWNYGSKSCRAQRFQAAFEAATVDKPLLVSHPDPSFQKAYCDQSIVLGDGRIVFHGDLSSGRAWLKERKQRVEFETKNNSLTNR